MTAVPPIPAALKSRTASEARKLHEAALEAAEAVQIAHVTNAEAVRQLHEATDAYNTALAEARGHMSPEEEILSQALASAQIRASDDVQQRRLQAATHAAADAALAYVDFCRDHAAELLTEYRSVQEKASTALTKAEDDAAKLLEKPRQAVADARELLDNLLPLVQTVAHPEPLDWTNPDEAVLAVVERAADPEEWDAARAAEKFTAAEDHQQVVAAAVEREQAYLAVKSEMSQLQGLAASGKLQGQDARLWATGQHPVVERFNALRPGTHMALAEERAELFPFFQGGNISEAGLARYEELERLMAEHPARHIIAGPVGVFA